MRHASRRWGAFSSLNQNRNFRFLRVMDSQRPHRLTRIHAMNKAGYRRSAPLFSSVCLWQRHKIKVLSRLSRVDERMANWIPPRERHGPPLTRPCPNQSTSYGCPSTRHKRCSSRRSSTLFTRHYTYNQFYHRSCRDEGRLARMTSRPATTSTRSPSYPTASSNSIPQERPSRNRLRASLRAIYLKWSSRAPTRRLTTSSTPKRGRDGDSLIVVAQAGSLQ